MHDEDTSTADLTAPLREMFPNAPEVAPRQMTEEIKKLWADHRKGSVEARNRLVEEYFPVIEANVKNVIETILEAIEESDFHQAGMVGYLEAFEEYGEEESASFEDFSSLKIRKAILDELKSFVAE